MLRAGSESSFCTFELSRVSKLRVQAEPSFQIRFETESGRVESSQVEPNRKKTKISYGPFFVFFI